MDIYLLPLTQGTFRRDSSEYELLGFLSLNVSDLQRSFVSPFELPRFCHVFEHKRWVEVHRHWSQSRWRHVALAGIQLFMSHNLESKSLYGGRMEIVHTNSNDGSRWRIFIPRGLFVANLESLLHPPFLL